MTAVDMTAARARAESLMASTCELRERATGEPVTDPVTGETTPAVGALVYSGKCRIRPVGGAPVTIEGGEAFSYDFQVALPAATTGVTGGQLLTVTSSPDPDLIGRVLEVERVTRGDSLSARRLLCNGMSM